MSDKCCGNLNVERKDRDECKAEADFRIEAPNGAVAQSCSEHLRPVVVFYTEQGYSVTVRGL